MIVKVNSSTILKPCLLAIIFLIDVVSWPGLYREMGLLSFLRIPLGFGILAATLVAAAYTPKLWLRLAYAVVFAICSLLILSYRFSVGEVTTYFAFATTIDARSAFGDAIQMHYVPMLAGSAAALATFFAIAIAPPKIGWFENRRFLVTILLMPLLVYIGFCAFLFDRQGQIRGIPSSWQGAGFATMYALDSVSGNSGPRAEPEITLTDSKNTGDIVFIIDESVSGNYLDLNAVGGAYSGLGTPKAGWSIHDFGIAASIVSCSVPSHVAMRFGGRRGDIRQKVARWPSIWSYAKQAGYRTVYMYGQRGGRNENYVTDEEAQGIDSHLRYQDISKIERDHKIASDIVDHAQNNVREFIVVNKMGAHFPLVGKYPEEPRPFQPEGNPRAVVKDAEFWRLYRNNYRNALEWLVGGFFDRIFDELGSEGPPLTIVYTADHGQTFYENSEPGSITHCRPNPNMEEGAVPLVVIERGKQDHVDWSSGLDARHDASGSARIFPSLLLLMGYDAEEVKRDYGSSLMDDDKDKMVTAAGFNLRSGPQTKWFRVDPATMFRPDGPHAEQSASGSEW